MDLQEFTKVAISEPRVVEMASRGLLQRLSKLLGAPVKTVRRIVRSARNINRLSRSPKRALRWKAEEKVRRVLGSYGVKAS